MLPAGAMERAAQVVRSSDVLVAVGSTLAVHPVASLVPLAKRSGARVVIVNRGATA